MALLGGLDNAKVLAGGQSLMPMMNMRYAMPDHLVDLNRVEGLAGVTHREGRLHIGSMTRQRELEVSADVAAAFPLFREALRHVGHRQTRNRGTIGGSLCHLDPAVLQDNRKLLARTPFGCIRVPTRGGRDGR